MKKHAFVPSIDGRLENRVVLNGARAAGIVVQLPDGTRNFVPNSAILTTRTYHGVLTNIHRSLAAFGRSRGTEADYARATCSVSAQLGRLPYARQEGLVDYVASALPYYAPSESHIAYSDLRSTVVSYLSVEVLDGYAAIRKSPGRYFSDADIYGPHARIYHQAAPE